MLLMLLMLLMRVDEGCYWHKLQKIKQQQLCSGYNNRVTNEIELALQLTNERQRLVLTLQTHTLPILVPVSRHDEREDSGPKPHDLHGHSRAAPGALIRSKHERRGLVSLG